MRAVIILLFILLGSCWAKAQNYILHSDIAYDVNPNVDPELLSLDIYEPLDVSELRPVVIYVHGGSWKGGTKNNVGSKADLLTNHNYVFVSINYRLSPNPPDTAYIGGVRFPLHPIDVSKAIRFVYDNIDQYNGDQQKIHLMGHSAGAHLVNLVGTNEYFLELQGLTTEDIGCVCSLDAGVFNLPFELEIADAARRLMLLNAFSLNSAFYLQASPLFNIQEAENLPDFLLVHQGTPLRIFKTEGFRDSLLAKGHSAVSFNAFPYSHGGINTGVGAPEDSIGMTELIMEFFDSCSGIVSGTDEIGNVSETSKINLFPNPSEGIFHFSAPEISGVTLYNSLGQELTKIKVANGTIDLSDFKKGAYLLKFFSGRQVLGIKKVVVY